MTPETAKLKTEPASSPKAIAFPTPRGKKRLKSQPRRFRMGMENSLAIKMIKY